MKFSFSSEQEEFRTNLRRFLADRSPTKEVRRLMETDDGYERDRWRAINAELGLTAIRIPESYGGHGFGFGEQCIVLEEMGRARSALPHQHRRSSPMTLPRSEARENPVSLPSASP